MENSSSGALPRGGQKNRMKNIFEKEDTEEHFDWGSAPGGGEQKGRKVKHSSSRGEKNRREEKWKTIRQGLCPGVEKNKMTPELKSEGKKNGKQFVRGSASGGEKQKGRRVKKQFVRGCARGEEE